MKTFVAICIASLSLTTVMAQEVTDALRYAQNDLHGTARFRAMSGAFGALGGDFSSLNVNPAGSAVFSNSQVGVTLSSLNTNNKSEYFGSRASEVNNSFDLNQAGGIFVFNNNSEKTNWKKFVLAVNYDSAGNFDNSVFTYGTNPTASVSNYFTHYANAANIPVGDFADYFFEDFSYHEQQAYLGYQAYIINPTDPSDLASTTYVSNVPVGGNYYQENFVESTGYNGKLSFNVGAQYQERLYFGLNLNTHFTDYIQTTSFYEDNFNLENVSMPSVRSLRFTNDLYTYGSGFSFQLGTIAKITPSFRIGLAYESPTWYEFTDELRQTLTSSGYNYGDPPNPDLTYADGNSDVTIVYAPYRLQTPGKWTGSVAYVFGKTALLSIDYAVKDYSNTKFKPNDVFFNPTNQAMENILDIAGELRIGAEYRIKQWSLRGGFRNEQSPYKNGKTIGDLTGFSGGFGYNFGRTRLDLAYSYAQRDSQQSFFSRGFNYGAHLDTRMDNISATLLFEL